MANFWNKYITQLPQLESGAHDEGAASLCANAVYAVRIIHNANLVGAEKYSAIAAAIAAETARWAAEVAAYWVNKYEELIIE